MRTDVTAHHRRMQGRHEKALAGGQPPQDHGRAQRFGNPRPLLHVRNAAGLFSVALLLGGLREGHARPPASTQPSVRPPPLPAAAASGSNGYTAVPASGKTAQAVAVAAAGCLQQPARCPQMIAGAALIALGGVTAGAWAGWHAHARHASSCDAPGLPSEPPQAAALAAPPTPDATTQRSSDASNHSQFAGFQPRDLDPAHPPCVSLYDHVNARWANATAIPEGQTRWHVSSVLAAQTLEQQRRIAEHLATLSAPTPAQRVVADLWTSGMDESHINSDQLRPLRGELAALSALNSPQAVEQHLRQLTAKGRNPLFGLAVEPDLGNRSTQIAYVFQGGLGLPSPAHYLADGPVQLQQDYRQYIAQLLQLSGTAAATAQEDARAIFALEQRFANASVPREELRSNLNHTYNPISAVEADAITPHFSWSGLFQFLGVEPSQRFSLATVGFHEETSAALADTDPAVWRAYLRFHCLDSAAPYLDDRFAQAAHAFQQRLLDQDQPLPPRWKRVLASMDTYAGSALGEAYVDAHFPASTRARISRMVEQMRVVLKRRLGTVTWLDEVTRWTAQAKADLINPRIGHPDQWPDWSELRTERCGYLRNLRLACSYQQRADLRRIGQPLDPQRWRIHAHSVNAYFDVMNNDMGFSAGMLQPPFFDPDADDALNYGAIGVIIGHEMSHAFSAETSRFELGGGLGDWWSERDHERFNTLSAQLAAQFDQQRIDGLPVNGTTTANENLADLGGLVLALDALHDQAGGREDPMIDGLTREQRFFISWAVVNRRLQTRQRLELELATDPHTFGAPRADVAASNLADFAEAFQCAAGMPMARNASDRVTYL